MRILLILLSIIASIVKLSFSFLIGNNHYTFTYPVCGSFIPEIITDMDDNIKETIPQETASEQQATEEPEVQTEPVTQTQPATQMQPATESSTQTQPATESPTQTQPAQTMPQATEVSGGNLTKPSASSDDYIQRMAEVVNQERAKEGLKPLVVDSSANNAAMIRAKETVRNFSHTRPDGSSFSTVMKESGISYSVVGENIAYGYPTAEEVVAAWMTSSTHRENILSGTYTHIGIACYIENGVEYWAQIFYK